MYCNQCGLTIDEERIKFFIEFKDRYPETCTKCSKEQKNIVFMDYGHKTAGEAVVIDVNSQNGRENLRRAKRIFERRR